MANPSWPVSGFIRFASSRITVRANLWLVSKIIWIAFDGAYEVVDHTQLLFEQASIISPLAHRLGRKVITFSGLARRLRDERGDDSPLFVGQFFSSRRGLA